MRAPTAARKSTREGAHCGERETSEAVIGSCDEAASQRRRAQKGVAAAARAGQMAVVAHVARSGKVSAAVKKEVNP